MVAIEHRSKSSTTTLLSPSSASTSSQSTTGVSTPTTKSTIGISIPTTTTSITTTTAAAAAAPAPAAAAAPAAAVVVTTKATTATTDTNSNTKNIKKATKIMSTSKVSSPTAPNVIREKSQQQKQQQQQQQQQEDDDNAIQEINKRTLKLDLNAPSEFDESFKSPKSPIVGRLPSHQTSLISAVDVEDRKTLREALYQGIFHRHRRTIFAVGSFLRMLRSRNSQYNTIRSSSENDEEIR